jgi:hypothetical protein
VFAVIYYRHLTQLVNHINAKASELIIQQQSLIEKKNELDQHEEQIRYNRKRCFSDSSFSDSLIHLYPFVISIQFNMDKRLILFIVVVVV